VILKCSANSESYFRILNIFPNLNIFNLIFDLIFKINFCILNTNINLFLVSLYSKVTFLILWWSVLLGSPRGNMPYRVESGETPFVNIKLK